MKGQFFLDYMASPQGALIFTLLILWSLVWKGLALWKSARADHRVWYVVLLVVNTVGLLDIFYIYVINKNKEKK